MNTRIIHALQIYAMPWIEDGKSGELEYELGEVAGSGAV